MTLQNAVQNDPVSCFNTYERNFKKYPIACVSIIMAAKKKNAGIHARITAKIEY